MSLGIGPVVVRMIGGPFFRWTGRRPREYRANGVSAERVLVVRLDEIGDVVLTTPFLRELRRCLPNAWISLVVKPTLVNLVERCPHVNEILTYDWEITRPWRELRRHWRAIHFAMRQLWSRRFDVAILPRWDVDHYHATYIAYFSGAPQRVGYTEAVTSAKRRQNRGYDRLLTHTIQGDTVKHEVERGLQVIRSLGWSVEDDRLELWLSEDDERYAVEFYHRNGVSLHELLIAMGPGAGFPKRQWPVRRFGEVGAWLRRVYDATILIIGGAKEQPLARYLGERLGAGFVDATAVATLRHTAALLRRCQLYVGNDTGPMHLAAAVGVPVVEVSGHPTDGDSCHPNSPTRFGPWGVPHRVLRPVRGRWGCKAYCRATRPHCILDVSVEDVKVAVVPLMEEAALMPKRVVVHST